MDKIEEAEKRLKLLEEREAKANENLERFRALPFHLKIQQEGYEDVLKRVEETQEIAFMKFIKSSYPKIKEEDKKDLFAEFMTEYLNGKTKNMIQFLGVRFGECEKWSLNEKRYPPHYG